MLAASLVLASVLKGQDVFAQPVDYTAYGASASRVVSELAAKTGANLKAGRTTDQDLIAIHTANQPLSEVMDAIAKATSNVWSKQSDGGYLLTPDTARRNRERIDSEQRKLKAFADTIKRLTKAPSTNSETGEPEFDQTTGNSMKAWASILQKVDQKRVSQMKNGERLVFATGPTRMQLPLPPIGAELQALIKAHNAAAANFNPGMDSIPEEMRDDPQMKKIFELGQKYSGPNYGPVKSNPVKVLVAFEKSSQDYGFYGDFISVTLIAFDAEGKIIMRDQQMLASGDFGMEAMMALPSEEFDGGEITNETAPPQPTKEQLKANEIAKSLGLEPDKEVKSELPEVLKEISELMVPNRFGMFSPPTAQKKELSEEARNMLLHPTEYDPIGLVQGVRYTAFAKGVNKPLVAALPDADTMYMADNMTAAALILSLTTLDYSIANDNGWIQIIPPDPHAARLHRLDRAAWETLLAQYEAKGSLTLDEMANFAYVNDDYRQEPAARLAMRAIMSADSESPMMFMMGGGQSKWSVLRFFGSLTNPQRNQLRQGQSIRMGALTQAQLATVYPLVYGADANLFNPDPKDEEDIKREFGGFLHRMFMEGGLSANDYLSEPTEVAPNGLTPDGLISCQIEKQLVIKPVNADGKPMPMPNMAAQEIAVYESMQRMMSTIGSEGMDMMPRLDKGMVGSRSELMISVLPTPKSRCTYVLNEDSFTDKKAYFMNELPDWAKESYLAAQKEMAIFQKLFQMGVGQEQQVRPIP